ncbi:hypothetical protein QAD02_001892 [Eretmocerus hayati]|uniref:Uncharacterized protein n=1 Tax=Eretmocerus hayati TaxID=131215 RepID=A0ACC2NI94_9HYME|nr:hypothetical protein QAD02_001892 [Eretmocerus hayati]
MDFSVHSDLDWSPDQIRAYVDAGFEVNHVFDNGTTLLGLATHFGSYDVVQYLLDHGADPAVGVGMSETGGPVFAAIRADRSDILELLLRTSDSIALVNQNPEFVRAAVYDGTIQTVQVLLKYGLDPHMQFTSLHEYETILIAAARNGCSPLVHALIKAGAKVTATDHDGHTCLHFAVMQEDVPMTSAVLKAGADPNIFDRNGVSVLAYAIRTCNSDVIEVLLSAGCNPDIIDAHGMKGKSLQAALWSNQLHLFWRLIETGANVNFVNYHRESVLDTCLECLFDNRYDSATCGLLFQILVRRGGSIHKMRSFPFIPLAIFQFGSCSLLQSLIDCGLSIRTDFVPDPDDLPLHLALDNPNEGFLQSLIETHNLDIEKRDRFSCTVFFQACMNMQLAQMKLLYRLGANVNVCNSENVTSLQCTILPDVISQCFQWLCPICSLDIFLQTLRYVVSVGNTLYQIFMLKFIALVDSCCPLADLDCKILSVSNCSLAIYQSCQNELAQTQILSFDGVSIYDLFFINKESLLARNKIVQIGMAGPEMSHLFPIYWKDLHDKFIVASKHQNIIEKAGQSLCHLLQCEYSSNHIAIELICSYLDPKDLVNLCSL